MRAWLLSFFITGCSSEEAAGDPCASVDCGPHGECIGREASASCLCYDGWVASGLTCVEGGDADTDADTDTDGDSDTGSASDTDSGSDTSSGSNTGSGSDTSTGSETGTECPGSLTDCDGECADVDSDPANCGICGRTCLAPNAAMRCSAGECEIGDCDGTFLDCNFAVDDGCETDGDSDGTHCGSCDTRCSAPHATMECVAGSCAIDTCDGTWLDCNLVVDDGCEADRNSNVDNCGGCGLRCSVAHANEGCVAGVCVIAGCEPGYCNANGSYADGCELDC